MSEKYIVKLIGLRMMKDYDFLPSPKTAATTSENAVSTHKQPSKRTLQNILNFARCCQNINVKDVKFKLYLN